MPVITPTKVKLNTQDVLEETFNIFDDVHGYIEIPERLRLFLDTPQFQRLRKLKQLGVTYFVYPGASHNRFEHSLGVMHLAGKFMKALQSKQQSLGITDDDIFCVQTAGLLHDLGHGPFSHVFDNQFMAKLENSCHYCHEDMSIKLVDYLIDDNDIIISDEHRLLIKALISPKTHEHVIKKYKSMNPPKGFLFEVVSNDSNSIDVDKWDYMLRDSKNMNLGITFNYERMLKHVRVFQDAICYQYKTHYDIYMMFRTRYELFKRAYSHKTSKSIEFMICDVLHMANPVLNIVEKTRSPETFMELTDNIIHEIEYSKNPKLEAARQLIARIRKRQLYKCVGSGLLDSKYIGENKHETEKYKHILFNDLPQNLQEKHSPDDIIVDILDLHYGMSNKNPVEHVWLYENLKAPQIKRISVDRITLMNGSTFSESILRVFVKNKKMASSVGRAFDKFYNKQFHDTPSLRENSSDDKSSPAAKNNQNTGNINRPSETSKSFWSVSRLKRKASYEEEDFITSPRKRIKIKCTDLTSPQKLDTNAMDTTKE